MALTGSVVSYPERGPYGRANWRGNTTGYLVRDLLETFNPSLVADPMCGSNTTGDVVDEMNRSGYQIQYVGLDLHSGFDVLSDSLAERLPRAADFIFAHPPYHDMVKYSGGGGQWGREAHPADLSRCESYEDFLSKLERACLNLYEATRNGGHYAIQIGDLRRAGTYYAMQAHLVAIAPGALENIIIKRQHNCQSDRRGYGNSRLIRIEHEYVCVFRRDGMVFGMFDAALNTSSRLKMLSQSTWRAVVEYALEQLGGKASLDDLYGFIEERAKDRIRSPFHKEKIRQTVTSVAVRLERGVYATQSYATKMQQAA
jgi:hypothetical protein